jgi:hypothetical protein
MKFEQRIPEDVLTQISPRTLAVWHAIYDYISDHCQTDAFDLRLQKTLSEALGKWFSDATLRRHFKRMADAGLIQSHRIVVRYSDIGKAWLGAGYPFRGDGPPPGMFLRYTLPGGKPSLERVTNTDDALAPASGG